MSLNTDAKLGSGVSARMTGIKAISAKTSLPGQVGGPSVAISLQLINNGSRPIDVQNTVVNVLDSAHNPAVQITTSPARAFRGTLAAGARATAVYVYSISTTRRNPITVELNYAAGTPVAHFIGGVK